MQLARIRRAPRGCGTHLRAVSGRTARPVRSPVATHPLAPGRSLALSPRAAAPRARAQRDGFRIGLALAAAAAVCATANPVRADGELSIRGVYYKERATRVQQPAVDGRFDVGDEGEASGYVLLDAITSASVASGAADQAFTEYRWEAGASYMQRFDALGVGGGLRYSTEPDYKSIFASLRGELELADKNTTVDWGSTPAATH